MTIKNFPDHVPPSLIRDFNFYDMKGELDPYLHFKKLHAEPDIFYTPHHGGHWVASRYSDMEYIFTHPEDFSSRYQSVPIQPIHITMVEDDGVKHDEFRNLMAPFFTPKAIGALEKTATEITGRLIDEFYAKGECEFASDFAKKMPIIIVMNLLDLPHEDTPYLMQISEEIVRSGDPQVLQAAWGRVYAYLGEKILPARRSNPGKDMISAIMQGKVDGGRSPTEEEVLGLVGVLIGGGLDTVASMLGFITLFLAKNPDHRRQLLDDPALIPNALEELIRRFAVLNYARTVTNDMEYRGVHFKAGDIVMTPTSCAGIDDRRFSEPMKVDFQRADKKHLSFGRGPHQCIGAYLARTELRVFLTTWLQRIPHFEVKAGDPPITVAGKANAVRYLPLTWAIS